MFLTFLQVQKPLAVTSKLRSGDTNKTGKLFCAYNLISQQVFQHKLSDIKTRATPTV
jgi:hypothetical protein